MIDESLRIYEVHQKKENSSLELRTERKISLQKSSNFTANGLLESESAADTQADNKVLTIQPGKHLQYSKT